ncbi:hypothetical protein Tdes44962_MAKER08128 [Teratosphaeria destructans]|uniref:Uncharacterized protein n=1 Tax=Teratosphaeria destructans TaxID=418781 RepID=A0A9W7W4Y3_9PEZI|nr:hypothetical protein Tdes44962_MAKER08128 [Teratosphaeria destructans]
MAAWARPPTIAVKSLTACQLKKRKRKRKRKKTKKEEKIHSRDFARHHTVTPVRGVSARIGWLPPWQRAIHNNNNAGWFGAAGCGS